MASYLYVPRLMAEAKADASTCSFRNWITIYFLLFMLIRFSMCFFFFFFLLFSGLLQFSLILVDWPTTRTNFSQRHMLYHRKVIFQPVMLSIGVISSPLRRWHGMPAIYHCCSDVSTIRTDVSSAWTKKSTYGTSNSSLWTMMGHRERRAASAKTSNVPLTMWPAISMRPKSK